MDEKPLVSIITPCYNAEKWISRYIDSAINQTYKNIQLIFVNDGSTDSTEQVLLNYKDKIENCGLKFTYKYQTNKGIGGAINTGLKLIEGEYFAWCDTDNFYTPDYVEQKVKFFLSHPQYSIVRCDGYVVKDKAIDKPVSTMAKNNNDKYNEHLFYNALEIKNFHFGCAMIKTSDFDKVNPKREIYESREGQNWQLLLPMFYSFKSGYIDNPMFYFVERSDSVSNISYTTGYQSVINQNNEYIKILTKTVESINMPDNEREKCINIIKNKYYYINFSLSCRLQDPALIKENYNKIKQLKSLEPNRKIKCIILKHKLVVKLLKKMKKI